MAPALVNTRIVMVAYFWLVGAGEKTMVNHQQNHACWLLLWLLMMGKSMVGCIQQEPTNALGRAGATGAAA